MKDGTIVLSAKLKGTFADENELMDVRMTKYSSTDRPALLITNKAGEPQFTATVNMPTEEIADDHVFLKGWSENEGLPEALEEAGLVKLTGRTCPAGFCEALEAKLLLPKTDQEL